MTTLHINCMLAFAALCVGYLVVVLGNALAFRIRGGRREALTAPAEVAPAHAKVDPANTNAPREFVLREERRRKRAAQVNERKRSIINGTAAEPADGFASPPPSRSANASDAELIAALVDLGIARSVAQAAARHALGALGKDAAVEALVREALRACPRPAQSKAAA